jgi:hypothetical protein
MAVVAESAVTKTKMWVEGDKTLKQVNKCFEGTIALSSQGDATDSIPASVFGLRYIREVTCAISSTDKWVEARPSFDGSKLLIFNPAQATDANRIDPATVTYSSVRVVVKGY